MPPMDAETTEKLLKPIRLVCSIWPKFRQKRQSFWRVEVRDRIALFHCVYPYPIIPDGHCRLPVVQRRLVSSDDTISIDE
jgi:hypothetical protein